MFIYRHLILLLQIILFRRKKSSTGLLRFIVSPFDCDINFHLNNGNYLKFMDLGRWDLLITSGLWKMILKEKMIPVVVAINIHFIKALPPFAKFNLKTTVTKIGNKSMHIAQLFERKGIVYAEANVVGALVKGHHSVPLRSYMKKYKINIKKLGIR